MRDALNLVYQVKETDKTERKSKNLALKEQGRPNGKEKEKEERES